MLKGRLKRLLKKDQKDYKELVYEGYAPHGIAILVETATDNPTRTVANIRSYFTKYNGSLGTTGMLDFLFERKCSFKVEMKEGINLEELELELIDFGVEEIFAEDENIMIFAEFTKFGPIQRFLEEHGMNILSFNFERIPNDTKSVTPEQLVEIEKLIEKIEEDDDVTNVFHNIKSAE